MEFNYKKEFSKENIQNKVKKYNNDMKDLEELVCQKAFARKKYIKGIVYDSKDLSKLAKETLVMIKPFEKYYKKSIMCFHCFKILCFFKYRMKFSDKALEPVVKKYLKLEKDKARLLEKLGE